MDAIIELNPHPCRACFKGDGKPEGIIPVIMIQDNFQYSLKLLEIERVGNREIAAVCPSGVQAVLADRIRVRESIEKARDPEDSMHTWQEKET